MFVNGALAVPGAPANTDTVPAKFSEKNDADDKLITLAYTFKLLTDEQRRAIYEGLKGQEAGPAFNADIGVELPSSIELHPVPNDVAARVTQTQDYRYAVADKLHSRHRKRYRVRRPSPALGAWTSSIKTPTMNRPTGDTSRTRLSATA